VPMGVVIVRHGSVETKRWNYCYWPPFFNPPFNPRVIRPSRSARKG
jgi:hypothetical protein